jgi:hypothetical protein
MGRNRSVVLVLAVALTTAIACTNPTAPDPSVRVEPIQIDSVTVLVAPPRASAHVRGAIGDGCSILKSVTQVRSGNSVTLTILRERAVDAVCIQVLRLYDETILLEGSYPAGRYTLKVNGVEVAFLAE